MAQDPYSRVACECYASTNLLIIGGEITTNAVVDFEAIARKTIREIGYTNIAYGMDADTCEIKVIIKKQKMKDNISENLKKGVNYTVKSIKRKIRNYFYF